MNTASEYSQHLEKLRREPHSSSHLFSKLLDTEPDRSAAELKIDVAMIHLDESLNNKQKCRTELAFKALEEGVHDLRRWLILAGYKV